MPLRDTTPTGAPCWIDVFSTDTDRTEQFYGQLFGWTADHAGPEFGGYINFSLDGALVAGCVPNDGSSGAPDAWSVYLAVDDAAATVESASTHGAQVIVPAMAVSDLGTMAIVADAGGAVVGMWQPGLHRGMGVLDEPGAAAWFELHARQYDAAVPFYAQVFGWDTHVMSDDPSFRYTTFGEAEHALAGISDSSSFLPEGVPPHWLIYFKVADTDAALVRVVELGGTVLRPAEDTPYGRLAQVADPTGAIFSVMGPVAS